LPRSCQYRGEAGVDAGETGGWRPGEKRARIALVVACALAIAGLVGCDWRQGKAEDVAACVDRCITVGCEFAGMDVSTWDSVPKRGAVCRCKRSFAMPLAAADAGTVSR
jgi:hypothetical protein